MDLEHAAEEPSQISASASRVSRMDDQEQQEASVSRGVFSHESTVVGSRAPDQAASSSSHPRAAAAASSSSSSSASHSDPSMFSAEAFPSHSSQSSLPFGAVAARLPAGSAAPTHPPRGAADKLMDLNMRAALLERTPPPPYPEYQKWGKNKAVGIKGKTFWVGLKMFGGTRANLGNRTRSALLRWERAELEPLAFASVLAHCCCSVLPVLSALSVFSLLSSLSSLLGLHRRRVSPSSSSLRSPQLSSSWAK